MSKKFNLLLSVCVLHAFNMSAKNVSAEHALESALQELTSLTRTNARLSEMQLVDSRTHNGQATLYIFSSPTQYVIASADESAPNLIAYSLDGSFSEDMPPAMQWWLEQYSESIGISMNRGATPTSDKEDRTPISPMLTTEWSQEEPFNSLCPLHDGVRPLTGCVATAVAQILRFHSYPEKGTGNTAWTCKRDGYYHDHYHDFEPVTFDWNNMIDIYDSSASQEEKTAVAELMLACGAASEMQYSPYASGSFLYTAGKGIIDYLGYDRSLEYLERNWFAHAEDWDNICYQELAEGRPILYGGEHDVWHTRHAFVMDGYSEEGLYHINWGWEGKNDGFFRLNDFSFEGGNYRINHALVRGIKPASETSDFLPSFSLNKQFSTYEKQYNKESGVNIWFKGDIRNESMTDFWIDHGVRCVPTDGSPEFIISGERHWYRVRAVNTFFELPADSFPPGIYDLYPVFKTDTSDWLPIYQNQDDIGDGVRFEVTETTIKRQSSGIDDISIDNDIENTVYYNLSGIKVDCPVTGLYIKVTDGKAAIVKL